MRRTNAFCFSRVPQRLCIRLKLTEGLLSVAENTLIEIETKPQLSVSDAIDRGAMFVLTQAGGVAVAD